MEYKYGDIEAVVAKRDFEVFKHDEQGDLIGVATIPKGCKGNIESMGSSSTNFEINYDVCFKADDTEVNVSIKEDNMEIYLLLNK